MRAIILVPLFLGLASLRAQTPGAFTATGSMTTPRQFHTATLLTNGKVLITGGEGPANSGASAELYDPSTGTFTATGNMSTPRWMHVATLLPSGKVLIVGGGSSAELYDPDTGTFTATGVGSGGGPAALLNNGRVLIVGNGGVYVYDPSTGTITFTGIGGDTATLLPNGKVLITNSDSAWLYDPANGTLTPTADMIVPGLGVRPVAVLLTNGKVLIAGGSLGDFGGSDIAEIYDPASGTFSVTGKMTAGIDAWLAAALLPDGKVLISGEDLDGCQPIPQDTVGCPGVAELYDPVAGTFSSPGRSQSEEGHAETLLPDGTVLITGGWYFCGFMPAPGCGGVLAKAQIYHPGVLVPAPRLFSLSGDPGGQGAIWHSQTGLIASSQNPAVAGEILSMYTTSLAENGLIPPQVAVGGRLGEILYFGDAPGYPGYFQVNFRVPGGVTPGQSVPVRLTYLGRSTNTVTVGVQ